MLGFRGRGAPPPEGSVTGGGGCAGPCGLDVEGGGWLGSLGVTIGGCCVGGTGLGGVGSSGGRKPGGIPPGGPRNCPPWPNAVAGSTHIAASATIVARQADLARGMESSPRSAPSRVPRRVLRDEEPTAARER